MIDIEKCKELSGQQVVVNTESVVRLNGGKKNPMVGNVTKVVTGAIATLGEQGLYEGQRKEKDESFVLKPAKWGKRVGTTCVIEHKGNYYVELIYKSGGDVKYMFNGEEIAKSDIVGLVDRKSESDEAGVVLRRMKAENIKDITVFVG